MENWSFFRFGMFFRKMYDNRNNACDVYSGKFRYSSHDCELFIIWNSWQKWIQLARERLWLWSWCSTRLSQTTSTTSKISTYGATTLKTSNSSKKCPIYRSSPSVSTKSAPSRTSPNATNCMYPLLYPGTLPKEKLHRRSKRNQVPIGTTLPQIPLALRQPLLSNRKLQRNCPSSSTQPHQAWQQCSHTVGKSSCEQS